MFIATPEGMYNGTEINMKEYAIFLDIDGTLVGEKDFPLGGCVSAENIRAINKARAAGHYVFLNTGRSYAWIQKAVIDELEVDGIISGIGTQILMHGKELYECMIPTETLVNIYNAFSGTSRCVMFGGTEKIYVLNPSGFLDDPRFVFIRNEKDFFEKCLQDKIQKCEVFEMSLAGGNVGIETIISEVQLKALTENLQNYSHTWYMESFPHGCTKSRAMLMTAEKIGISPKNTIAMGDSVNDADMLTAAGTGVAMGNAPELVKEKADFVSRACDENGVAYAIEKLLFNN